MSLEESTSRRDNSFITEKFSLLGGNIAINRLRRGVSETINSLLRLIGLKNRTNHRVNNILDDVEIKLPMAQNLDFVVCPPGEGERREKGIEQGRNIFTQDSKDQERIEWAFEVSKELDFAFDSEQHFFVSAEQQKNNLGRYHVIILPSFGQVLLVADEYANATYICPEDNWEKYAKMTKGEIRAIAENWEKYPEDSNNPRIKPFIAQGRKNREEWQEALMSELTINNLPKSYNITPDQRSIISFTADDPIPVNYSFLLAEREDVLEFARVELAKYGYVDRLTLRLANPHEFTKKKFGRFGSGIRLYHLITGNTTKIVTKKQIIEIADKIGFPPIKCELYRDILAEQGFSDREALVTADTRDVEAIESFGPFGKIHSFYTFVVGKAKQGKRDLTKARLIEIADAVEFSPISKVRYQEILKENGYSDRESLTKASPKGFVAKTYAGFGKGIKFLNFVTGGTRKSIVRADLEKLASIVFGSDDEISSKPPQDSEISESTD